MAEVSRHELEGLGNPGRLRCAGILAVWAVVMARACAVHYWRHRPAIRRTLPEVGDRARMRRLFAGVFRGNIPPFGFYRYKFYLERFYRDRKHHVLRWHLDPLLVCSIPRDNAR